MAYKVGDKIKYTKPGDSQRIGTIKDVLDNGSYKVQPSNASSGDTVLVNPGQVDGYAD